MPSNETIVMARRLFIPSFLINSALHWIRLSRRVLLKRLDAFLKTKLYKSAFYPAYIRPFISEKKLSYDRGFISKMENGEDTCCEGLSGRVSIKVRLATVEFIVTGLPDWRQTFNDSEDVLSLHRWGWLLMAAVERPCEEIKQFGINVMKDWFLKMNPLKNHHTWESYSMSERIVNALLFFYALRNFRCTSEDIDFIESNLINMAGRLLANLEFHGELTNNHILNNARALYIIGRLSSCGTLSDAGRSIFINETSKMITSDGFLREDSSSYQLLLLRTYLEILWVARRSRDDDFASKIEDVARSMVRASWTLNIYDAGSAKWSFPLVGDVTPDFPVDWTANICRSAPAIALYRPQGCLEDRRGWNGIFADSEAGVSAEAVMKGHAHKFFSGNGWYRADCGDIVIIWHINYHGSVPIYSHGHNDIFSFVLYWRGKPVFIDPGRYDYVRCGLGQYSRGAAAHNTFVMDGFEPYPIAKYVYPPDYRKGNSEAGWEYTPDGLRFRMSHDGFQRLEKDCKAFREFNIAPYFLDITDSIQGTGMHEVKSFFHLGEGIEISETAVDGSDFILRLSGVSAKFKLKLNGKHTARILSGVKGLETAGWSFPAYGKAEAIKTFIVETRSNFPYSAGYSIEFRG